MFQSCQWANGLHLAADAKRRRRIQLSAGLLTACNVMLLMGKLRCRNNPPGKAFQLLAA